MENKKIGKGFNILLYVAAVLTVFCLVMSIRGVILSDSTPLLRVIAIFIGYALVIFYGVYGYKKPHGDLLRYTMIGLAILLVLSIVADQILRDPGEVPVEIGALAEGIRPQGPPDMTGSSFARPLETLATGLVIILSSYIAGRLNKIEKNKYLFTLGLVLLVIRVLVNIGNTQIMLADINEIVLWLDLNCAYMLRYHEHKEAGLIDNA